jgi:hypothetical protein
VTTRAQAIATIGSNNGEKAEAQVGAVYALRLSNEAYASITITGINGSGNAASATLSILSE